MVFGKRTRPADFGAGRMERGIEAASLSQALANAELFTPETEAPEAQFKVEPQMAAEPAPAAPLSPPPAAAEVTSAQPQMPARRPETPQAQPRKAEKLPSAAPIYLIAAAAAGLWALAPIAFAIGYRQGIAPFREDNFALLVFALLAIGPAVLIFCAAYVLREAQKLAAAAARSRALADEMVSPAIAAAGGANDLVQGVRAEIARAAAAADEARETLLALRDALALETERLVEGTAASLRTAETLTGSLGRERTEMGALAETLDAQAAKVADAISHQAKMVTQASDLAETQMREAEAALSARAADLAAAAAEARDAARTAGEDLVRHIARLETAGVAVADQVRAVEGGLSEQRTALVGLANALRDDHAGFADEAEAHALKLGEFITQARISAVEMSDRAVKGGDSLRQLMSDAALQFRDLAETAKAEREEFGQATLQSLEAVSVAAIEQRRQLEIQTEAAVLALSAAAEQTREAAARHAATAREQVDQLSEAAFTAGQRANQVFEARLAEAQALVEQSARMVEEAGASSAAKLEAGAKSARASLAELQTMMGELEQRAVQLPVSARGQVDLVRTAVAKGMDELMAHARRTAHEAEAIDAAFQDRVRRNFEMLSEAVRLMGTVAAAPAPTLAPSLAPVPRPLAPRAPQAAPEPAPAPKAAKKAKTPEPPPEIEDEEDDGVSELELRPRLRLTPTVTDEAFSALFESAAAAAEAGDADGEWTWKDLLASIDGADAEGERLQDQLEGELARMGVDPPKLLPAQRITEIASLAHAGDEAAMRETVTRLAPAAVRRISRRLHTDESVRRKAQVYVRRYQTLIADAAVRDPLGGLTVDLLGEEGGRLFLLLDAAAGDA